mgnify:CR=1 FL=1
MPLLITLILGLVLALLAVFIHHECLVGIKRGLLGKRTRPRRWHVGATVLMLLLSHAVVILVFAVGLLALVNVFELGELNGTQSADISTFVYFSFSSYTSLGVGDLYPSGHLRLLTGFEALLGLLMIGWSASFLYLEMRTLWFAGEIE